MDDTKPFPTTLCVDCALLKATETRRGRVFFWCAKTHRRVRSSALFDAACRFFERAGWE